MVELLAELVRMESPSDRPESQKPILDRMAELLSGLGFTTRHVGGGSTGGHLFAIPEARRHGAPAQLLLGHSDTVWPVGTVAERPVDIDGDVFRGPGAFDMKGGLVQAVFALRALRELNRWPEVTPVVLVNSDEEIGSRDSSRFIGLLARRVRRAYVLEPALGPEGRIKTRRKGVGSFVVRIVGKSSHVGLAPEEGASAIQELTHVVQALHALSDSERGVSVNVGRIRGGMRTNVVAADASADVDVRVPDREAGRRLEQAIRAIESMTPGTRLEIEGGIRRAPLEKTPRNALLWEAARREGRRLGLELEEGTSGGASDGNLTSRHTATLDGLGAVGAGAHAEHEQVRIDRMVERCALLALLLLLPPNTTVVKGTS
ncbi:MAG: M20 family metallopeptidase [Gemmatimonadota bacterium]